MDEYDTPDFAQPKAQNRSSPASSSRSPSSLPDAEFEEYIKQYPFAAEPTYFTRPNRYYGPASTWRSWTAEERAIANDLESSRAKDLSVHLINAFALKHRYGQSREGQKPVSQPSSKDEIEAQVRQNDAHQDSSIIPDTWVAWPLRAEWVPRENLGEGTTRLPPATRNDIYPSAAIEDALIATTTRLAKERFEDREWAAREPRVKREKRNWQAERDLTKQQLIESGLLDDAKQETQATLETGSNTNTATQSPEQDEIEIESATESDIPEGVQTFSSQAFAAAIPSSSETESSNSDSEDERPVVSVDADQARRILLPSVRHTLSKLDDLLTGLHKARNSYASRPLTSRSRSRSVVSGAETTDDERLVRSGSRASVKKQSRKRKLSHLGEDSAPEQSRPRSVSHSNKKKRRAKADRLGLRDWSDVLGMAALTGWDTDVVGRASERCAKIFDQNMMFRTFHEKAATGARTHRSGAVFEEAYARASPIEHNAPEPESTEDSLGKAELAAANGDGEHPQHFATDNLPLETRFAESGRLSCPVRTCDQHTRVFTRSTRLYDHIRQSHPEFDMESFKKIVARSSKRGKYDRSRVRSKNLFADRQSEPE